MCFMFQHHKSCFLNSTKTIVGNQNIARKMQNATQACLRGYTFSIFVRICGWRESWSGCDYCCGCISTEAVTRELKLRVWTLKPLLYQGVSCSCPNRNLWAAVTTYENQRSGTKAGAINTTAALMFFLLEEWNRRSEAHGGKERRNRTGVEELRGLCVCVCESENMAKSNTPARHDIQTRETFKCKSTLESLRFQFPKEMKVILDPPRLCTSVHWHIIVLSFFFSSLHQIDTHCQPRTPVRNINITLFDRWPWNVFIHLWSPGD